MENIICSFGCGKPSKYFFKNGNSCCEKSPNSCKGKRDRDSDKKKNKGFKGIQYWKFPKEDRKSIIPWNKGKIGCYSEEHKKKISDSLKGRKGIGRKYCEKDEGERRKKISETMRKNKISGGLRNGSGRGKSGWYKGYWCDSSWELAWVIYNLDHNIEFERNTLGFEYEYKGIKRKYYPDFIKNEEYYEIKGRRSFEKMDEENKQKISQFKFKLKVLFEKDMDPYINYVIQKYGKDYIKLYD